MQKQRAICKRILDKHINGWLYWKPIAKAMKGTSSVSGSLQKAAGR